MGLGKRQRSPDFNLANLVLFSEMVSLAVLELTEILLLLPLECWDKRHVLLCPAWLISEHLPTLGSRAPEVNDPVHSSMTWPASREPTLPS